MAYQAKQKRSKPIRPYAIYDDAPSASKRPPHKRNNKFKKVDLFSKDQDASFLKKLLNQIGDEVMVIAKDATIVFANQATIKGLGYREELIVGKKITTFFKQKMTVAQWQRQAFNKLKRTKKAEKFIVDRVVKGGKVQTIEITANYINFKSQEYIVSDARNITEQRKLELKLQESERQYRMLSEQAADGIFTVDFKGNIIYANKAAEQLVKVPPKSHIGKNFNKFVGRESLVRAWQSFRKVKNGESVIGDQLTILDSRKNKIRVEFTVSPIYVDGKISQIHVMLRDITKRQELQKLKHDSEKMKALQQFVNGMTNEIQSPLQGLLDRFQTLITKYKTRDFEYIGYKEYRDIFRSLELMRDQMRYCSDTVKRLTNLYKKESGITDKYCEANVLIREAVKMLKHHFEVSDIKLKLQLGQRLPPIAIGSLEFSQMFTNVLTNAIQAIAGGGEIVVKTTYRKKEGFVRIECRDDGVGISRETLPRVFEPFFSTKHRGLEKSSGLGLAIVYSIVKAFHGEIDIRSSLRLGTTVRIDMPVLNKRRTKK